MNRMLGVSPGAAAGEVVAGAPHRTHRAARDTGYPKALAQGLVSLPLAGD